MLRRTPHVEFLRPFVALFPNKYWNINENSGERGRIVIGTHIHEQRGFGRRAIVTSAYDFPAGYTWTWKNTRMLSLSELRSMINVETKQKIIDVLVKEIDSAEFTDEYAKYREMTRRFSIDKVLSLPTNMIDVKYILEVLGASEIAKKL